MQLWQDGLVALLAAIGLAALMWAIVKPVLYRWPERGQRDIVALIPVQGDAVMAEEQVRALQRLRQEQGILGMVLLVDCGLSSEGEKISQLLAKEDRWVALCHKDEISAYLTE